MNTKITLLIGIFTGLIIGSPILADDTEIYITDATVTSARTNVLFGIDTSGSMASHVIEDVATDYDPNRDYTQLTTTEVNAGVSLTVRVDRVNGSDVSNYNRSFDCSSNSVYVNAWTRNALIPYQTLAGLTGDIRNDIQTTAGTKMMTCNGDFRNSIGYIDRVIPLTNSQVTCAAATEAINRQGYFFDANGDCAGSTVPVVTTNNSNDQANYLDNIFISGNFIAYAYRCTVLKDNFACDSSLQNFVTNRLELTKAVVHDIIRNDAGYEINVGIMKFNADLINTMQPIEDYPNPKTPLSTYNPSGGTPLENTFYEMYEYFAGSGYTSPITNSCQKNMIIYMTDGTPSSSDTGRHDEILNLANNAGLSNDDCSSKSVASGECIPLLAEYMNTSDLNSLPNYPDSNGQLRLQTVETHTIGFFDSALGGFAKPARILKNAAALGGGTYSQVANTSGLRNAFSDALNSVLDDAASFAAPTLTVDNFNRLTNNNELYYALFQPQRESVWAGNVKKYEFKNGQIFDANNVAAINESTGAFNINTRSFWTPVGEADGNDVTLGGFASRLTASRNVLSNLTANTNVNLNTTANSVSSATHAQMGLLASQDVEKQNLINWAYALDSTGTQSTNSIGDILHSSPVVLTYSASLVTDADGNTTTVADQTLFVGTNSGFLHAIDSKPANDGTLERFAFIPADLLQNASEFSDNNSTTPFSKLYGLDGNISSWLENDNGDRIIDSTSGEKAHLYLTMRRGGNSIYALDVTDRNNPVLEWQISNKTTDFEELGQTWSKVTPATIPYAGGNKNVLIFAGGYDPSQDNTPSTVTPIRKTDTQGRAIYIVDAETGDLLWSADYSQTDFEKMQYSIPSDIAVLDVNADGLTDRLYVGDMGGQLWRFDIMEPTAGEFINVSGDVIAVLAEDNSVQNNHKFYYPPSVSRVSDDVFGSYLSLALGSGKRDNPKGTNINDKFFMIKDPYVFSPKYDATSPSKPSYDYYNGGKIEDVDPAITDLTNNLNPSYTEIGQFGWSIDFPDAGEKMLSAALTADNKIFFTTYTPQLFNTLSCDPGATLGSGKLYAVSLLTGSPSFVKDSDNLSDLSNTEIDLDNATPGDRFIDLNTPGIPPAPSLILTPRETDTTNSDPLIDPLTGLPISVDPDTGYAVTIDPITGESTPVISSVTGEPVIIDPVTGQPDPVIDPDTGELVDPITGEVVDTSDCASNRAATLVVSKETFVPPICTAPVRTYWHRFVQ